jgi:hypothetical protein
MFGSSKRQTRAAEIAKHNREANTHDKEAREQAKKIAGFKKNLKSGSNDPAGLRYLIREHEQDMATAQHNARVCREAAEQTRKWRL